MWLEIEKSGTAKYRRPVMLAAVSTAVPQYRELYSQARELANYMMTNMKFEEVAVFHSSSFPPEVIVRDDGISTLPACRVYRHRGRRDIMLFAGDMSPLEDMYEFTHALLAYAKAAGVKELYSVGARWTESPVPQFQEPEVNGFATDAVGARALEGHGVKLIRGEAAPFFASVVVGMAAKYGIRGFKVSVDHGEPSPHPRSVKKMLEMLSQMMGFEIGLDGLKPQATEQQVASPQPASTIYH